MRPTTTKQAEVEIRAALAAEKKLRIQGAEEAVEGLIREHKIVPRVGRPPKKVEPPKTKRP